MKRAGLFFSLWLLVLLAGVFYIRRQTSPRPLAALWPIPPFQMTGVTTAGTRPLGLSDLLGQPWVAGFIYTRCAGPCPLISGKMAELQRVLPAGVRLVSFSVDPEHDTPDVLRRYATRFKADPALWVFVRGDTAQLYKLVSEGFRLAMVEDPSAPEGYRVTHSTKLALVDATGMLRRFYDVGVDSLPASVQRDLVELRRERS